MTETERCEWALRQTRSTFLCQRKHEAFAIPRVPIAQRAKIDVVDSGRPRDNAGMQNAESFNFELDEIAGFEPAPDMFRTKLEDTAEADRAATDDVAREKIGIARGVCDHSWKCVMKKRAVAARQLAAIDACVHLQRN